MAQVISEKQPSGSAVRGWVIGGVVLIIAWFIFSEHAATPDSSGAAAAPARAPTSAPTQSVWDKQGAEAAGGALLIRSSMRNPDSFQLSSVLDMPGPIYCYEYRAQNGFGGINVDRGVMKGETVKFAGMTGFDAMWNDDCRGKYGKDITAYVARLVKMVAK